MVQIFICWIWILLCSVLWGYLAIRCIKFILGRTQNNEYITLDYVIIFGIGVLAIFAEFFSLISGVGFWANVILLVVDLLVMICWRKDIISTLKKHYINKKTLAIKLGIVLFLALIVMSSMFEPLTYDTGLYHMQSILWIQKYGVVAGLGNLHHRFAYNSALMCLQALFSMKFLFGQQLHCVNGFILVFFLCYIVFSFKGIKYKRLFVSDFARLAFLVYFNFDYFYSSCGSDFASLCIVVYIVIKYIEGLESDINDIEYYIFISFMALIIVSFKLSVAMIVILTAYPLVRMLKDKQYRIIIKCTAIGIIFLLPYVIRNIIISGYLIYPFPALDLLSVDWKMNRYVCMWDSKEIQSWAQGIRNPNLSPALNEWFGVWWESLTISHRRLCVLSAVSIVVLVVISVIDYKNKTDIRKPVLSVTLLALCSYWFVSAPGMRFGSVYVILPPLILIGYILTIIQKYTPSIYQLGILTTIFVAGLQFRPIIETAVNFEVDKDMIITQVDKEQFSYINMKLGDVDIYIPEEGDRIGNQAFPSTPYMGNLELIELRGDSLENGFRVKSEYKDSCFNTYGNFVEPDIFE